MINKLKKSFLTSIYWDYALLLSVVILVFIIPVFSAEWRGKLYTLFINLIYLFAALSVGREKFNFVLMAFGVAILDFFSDFLGWQLVNSAARAFSIIFFFLIVFNFINQIVRAKNVGIKTILDAINGYLLIAIAFSVLILLMMRFNPEAFSFPGHTNSLVGASQVFHDYLYFSIVTITTLGYGDVLPVAPYAKSLATLISVTGQFYVAILVALIVGKFASNQYGKENNE